MPQMGYDMQEGTVVRWLKSEGAEVKLGEAIAEIETDKAVVELESTADGLLRKILVSEGSTVPVGMTIGIIAAEGEEVPDLPAETVVATEALPPAALPMPAAPPFEETEQPAAAPGVRASPVARRLAQERSIDLNQVHGTGPGGRITRDDVLDFDASRPAAEAEVGPAPAATPAAEAAPPSEAPAGERVPLTRMRQQIARVTVRSKQQIPHYYVAAEVDMTEAMELRGRINHTLEGRGVRVSVNDLIIKASVGALKKYPKFNAYFADDAVQMNEQINVGIAIAEEEGLIVPAIMDSGSKSLAEIARASKDLVDRSGSGTLHAQEYTGGTFSISNLGMFDVSSFIAIIHPPQSAVLAVGTVESRPVVRDGQVAVANMMTATLSADHRVSDGAEGARFILEVKRLLEDPVSLLV